MEMEFKCLDTLRELHEKKIKTTLELAKQLTCLFDKIKESNIIIYDEAAEERVDRLSFCVDEDGDLSMSTTYFRD